MSCYIQHNLFHTIVNRKNAMSQKWIREQIKALETKAKNKKLSMHKVCVLAGMQPATWWMDINNGQSHNHIKNPMPGLRIV